MCGSLEWWGGKRGPVALLDEGADLEGEVLCVALSTLPKSKSGREGRGECQWKWMVPRDGVRSKSTASAHPRWHG